MKKVLKKIKRANKVAKFLYLIIPILYIVSYIFFAKNVISLTGIETVIRYLFLFLCIIFLLIYLFVGFAKLSKRKYLLFYLLSLISIALIVIFTIGAVAIDFLYSKITNFNESDTVVYTSYLISLTDTTLDDTSILGMISDTNSIEGNILAKQIIKDNNLTQKIKTYDDSGDPYLEMLYDLYSGSVDAIFISSNYVTLYSNEEDFSNIAIETKKIYEASGKFKNEDASLYNSKSLNEPFTILVLGVDSEYDGLNANAAFNGDTLILATFNPTTLSATLLSIPRDTYVPIACRNNAYAKINSSAAYGTSCVIDTIEKLVDIDIDYYAKINFKGVVDLVEALGGITVNIEEPSYNYNHGNYCGGKVCEQDSNRMWGEYTIYIDPGIQRLNGEQALAYARCRGLYIDSDLARNRHQQDIIMAIANELLKIDNYSKFKDILDAISKNISVNMSNSQILSSYNIFKTMITKAMKSEDFISIQKTKLETYSLPVYLPSGITTSALGYYEASLEDVIKAIKVNLGLEEPEIVKTFSYSLNENYEAYVAGQGIYTGASSSVIASMIGKSRSTAENYCSENKINCSFTYIDDQSSYYDSSIPSDLISYQDPHAGTLLGDTSNINFYINGATSNSEAVNDRIDDIDSDEDIDSEELNEDLKNILNE